MIGAFQENHTKPFNKEALLFNSVEISQPFLAHQLFFLQPVEHRWFAMIFGNQPFHSPNPCSWTNPFQQFHTLNPLHNLHPSQLQHKSYIGICWVALVLQVSGIGRFLFSSSALVPSGFEDTSIAAARFRSGSLPLGAAEDLSAWSSDWDWEI